MAKLENLITELNDFLDMVRMEDFNYVMGFDDFEMLCKVLAVLRKDVHSCYNCKWLSDRFQSVCVNAESEHRADFVDGETWCDKWEAMEANDAE